MRMPGMDGSTLLRKVQARHPKVVRIVLSGHTEFEAALRSVPVAHQFLTKPCDAEVLKDVVERACNLNALLSQDAIRRVIGSLNELPLQPKVYTSLLAVLSNPQASLPEIARIVEGDLGLCAKILQLVNSSFFGLTRHVTNIHQAVSYLGTDTLKNLTLSVETFRTLDAKGLHGFSLEALHRHSIRTANLAKRMLEDRNQADDAFVAGLLHDVGKLILATRLRPDFRTVLQEAGGRSLPEQEVERQALGVSHAEIGAYLLGLWGLPYPVVEAVANHHHPRRVSPKRFDVLGAVHVANLLCREPSEGTEAASGDQIDMEYLESLGVADRLEGWKALAREELVRAAETTA
jgi:putative nucleotidyltransferase with HDIG domain